MLNLQSTWSPKRLMVCGEPAKWSFLFALGIHESAIEPIRAQLYLSASAWNHAGEEPPFLAFTPYLLYSQAPFLCCRQVIAPLPSLNGNLHLLFGSPHNEPPPLKWFEGRPPTLLHQRGTLQERGM